MTVASIDRAAGAKTGILIPNRDPSLKLRTGAFRLGLTSIECTDNAMRFICSEAFRPCKAIPGPNSTTISLPSQTCTDRCTAFVRSCETSLSRFNSSVPNCSGKNNATGFPLFADVDTRVPLGPNRTVTLPCNNLTQLSPWTETPRAQCYGLLNVSRTAETVLD